MTVVTIRSAPPTRRARSKAAARARIVKAAIGLFSKAGLHDVTVDAIAVAADVGKGTIYNYFQTKEEIVVAFMADFEADVQRKLQDLDAALPLHEVLAEFIRMQFRMKEPYHAFVRVFFGQMFLRTAEFVPHMLRIHEMSLPPIEGLFRNLQRRGLIRVDAQLGELVESFVILNLGLFSLWAIEDPPFNGVEQALVRQIRFFCEGIEARP